MSEFKCGECERCGYKGSIFPDNNLCDDCDGMVVRCEICNEDQDAENGKCRHVFKDEGWDWNGCGVTWGQWENCRDSFLRLCELMPAGFPLALFRAIKTGRFSTFFIAPLIGGGARIELRGFEPRWFHHKSVALEPDYGRAMGEIGEGEHAEECADGWRWLQSLWQNDSPKANATTLRWCMLAMGKRKP